MSPELHKGLSARPAQEAMVFASKDKPASSGNPLEQNIRRLAVHGDTDGYPRLVGLRDHLFDGFDHLWMIKLTQ
jgi:hypothetical protein